MAGPSNINLRGLDASKPAVSAATAGRLYLATDTSKLYQDTGTAWVDSGLGGGGASVHERLSYTLVTDISGLSCTDGAWVDVDVDQTFAVGSATGLIQIGISASVLLVSAGSVTATRLVIDSAGTPVYRDLGGDVGTASGVNIFAGGCTVPILGLSAGSHTVKTQIYSKGATGTLYCRPATQGPAEFYHIHVAEIA